MATPIVEKPEPRYANANVNSSAESSFVNNTDPEKDEKANYLTVETDHDPNMPLQPEPSPSQSREKANRLDDDLALLEAEQAVRDNEEQQEKRDGASISRTRSKRSEPVDEFDAATNPLHEQAAAYKPPEDPSTSLAKFVKQIHNSSFLIRYFTYIAPVVALLLIPLLLGALVFKRASVGGVSLLWFSVWLEIVWLTLWAGRIVAKCIPTPLGVVGSIFTNNARKWRDLGRQLELPATLFFWWLGVEISFLPTMKNHHLDGDTRTRGWETTMNKIIISIFVGTTLNFIEKIIIQLIAISFHLRTYADRIELNKFQIGSLVKLYTYSKEMISMEDTDFEEQREQGGNSGSRTPMMYADMAQKKAREALNKVGDVAGAVAGDFTGKTMSRSTHPHQVVLTLLSNTQGSQVLARRLYRTFVREGFDTVFSGDLKAAFDNGEEAEAAFAMFDKDLNGDISMEELEAVCVEIGRERKSITASLKDLDSVVSKLDDVFFFIVVVITILVFLSLISTSAAGVLTSAGSTLLALSWLFSATAQELLQSVIFVFVKHPFDVGDRVTIYGSTGTDLMGDDYYVKEIALLYTEFKKMQGHVVQAPNSYLNTLFILNQRRSGGLAEAVPIIIKFGTTLNQIDALRQRLLEFVRSEKREYMGNILTELRTVTENYSIELNVVFFYKSNWQNELLRLQRRNKFICTLMLALQDIGIEGPRMNLQGANSHIPYHITHQGSPPVYTPNNPNNDNGDDPTNPEAPVDSDTANVPENKGTSTGLQKQASILRNRSAATRSARAGSGPPKHVDFSLGMQDQSNEDIVSDVYWDRGPSKVSDVVRRANREGAEKRIREEEERTSMSGGSSVQPVKSLDVPSVGVGSRTSKDSQRRPSYSSSTRRNRFFPRLGSTSSREQISSRDGPDDDLMEQGRFAGVREAAYSPGRGTSQVDVHGDPHTYRGVPPEEYEMGRTKQT
ncbi:hypothetical protein FQN54_009257 [Arachnomyces sp. PD_36]|nr:hypothetical protein FQN54_009257 [Arachnomyces sp. PD_36]